jgi:hypothetical protein
MMEGSHEYQYPFDRIISPVTADVTALSGPYQHTGAVRHLGLRLYSVRAKPVWRDPVWALQVRAPLHLASGREGKKFMIATAHLGREELLKLREMIDEALGKDES